MKKNKNLIYIALLGAAAIAFFVLKKKKDTNKDEKLTNTDVNDTTTTPDIIKDVKNAIDTTPNPLETVIKVGKKIINKKTKQPVNTKYGGISKAAVNEILRISKQNLLQLNVVYLLPLQQQYIDLKFGPKTYDKFFNYGGKNLLDNNKTTPKTKGLFAAYDVIKKQPKKKTPKKRVKGFDDISVLY